MKEQEKAITGTHPELDETVRKIQEMLNGLQTTVSTLAVAVHTLMTNMQTMGASAPSDLSATPEDAGPANRSAPASRAEGAAMDALAAKMGSLVAQMNAALDKPLASPGASGGQPAADKAPVPASAPAVVPQDQHADAPGRASETGDAPGGQNKADPDGSKDRAASLMQSLKNSLDKASQTDAAHPADANAAAPGNDSSGKPVALIADKTAHGPVIPPDPLHDRPAGPAADAGIPGEEGALLKQVSSMMESLNTPDPGGSGTDAGSAPGSVPSSVEGLPSVQDLADAVGLSSGQPASEGPPGMLASAIETLHGLRDSQAIRPPASEDGGMPSVGGVFKGVASGAGSFPGIEAPGTAAGVENAAPPSEKGESPGDIMGSLVRRFADLEKALPTVLTEENVREIAAGAETAQGITAEDGWFRSVSESPLSMGMQSQDVAKNTENTHGWSVALATTTAAPASTGARNCQPLSNPYGRRIG